MTRIKLTHLRALVICSIFSGIISNSLFGQCPSSIVGDFSVCPRATETYRANILENLATYTWSVIPSTAGVVSNASTNFPSVVWTSIPGTYTLRLNVSGGPCPASPGTTINQQVVVEAIPPLACNNLVNLSMNEACMLYVTPDMVLEGTQYPPSSYDITLKDPITGTTMTNNMVDGTYVGKVLKVTVTHRCSQNSCWGEIMVEDKFIPPLMCDNDVTINCDQNDHPSNPLVGLPLPISSPSDTMRIDDYSWKVTGFDHCGPATLMFSDSLPKTTCASPWGKIIYRKWIITDGSGRMNMCKDTIYVRRANIDDIDFPPNFDGDTALNCKDKENSNSPNSWIPLPNGNPSPETTGYPTGALCDNLEITYFDTKYEKCGDSAFKIKRHWSVLDWCTSELRQMNQLIAVLDDDPPICIPPPEFSVYSTGFGCLTSFKIPPILQIFDCSSLITVRVGYKVQREGDILGDFPFSTFTTTGISGPDANGFYMVNNVETPNDTIWIAYEVEDGCGNICEARTEAYVIDTEEPIAICDKYTTVGLNEEGMAWADVYAFDDGSWDNCSLGSFEVRRMESSSCGMTNTWGDEVKFCCADVGKTIMVQLRVYDSSGNSNSCMVEVEVQDNSSPTLIYCPPTVNLTCGSDYSDLSKFGQPIFEDKCASSVIETVEYHLNTCGVGYILRKFTASDANSSTICTQRININNSSPFGTLSGDIDWPDDYIFNGCPSDDHKPENFPSRYGWPILKTRDCAQAAADYEDLEFQLTEEACLKILRQWTVIDWCQFDPSDPDKGTYYHTQVIKIRNSQAPTFTSGCSNKVVDGTPTGNDCSYYVEVKATATDQCSAINKLIWTYKIDIDNNGSVEYTGSTNDASRVFPLGSHKISWTVKNSCGNIATCSQIITIKDKIAPIPYCRGELVTVVMEETASVTIWASDFDLGSSDACTQSTDLEISFSPNINDKFRTFTCGDLAGAKVDTFPLKIYVTDKSGNADFCTVDVIIQDNANRCSSSSSSEFSNISGLIFNENHDMLANVEVMLAGNSPEYPLYNMTDDDGQYAFNSIPMNQEYMLEPSFNDDYNNGVSTLDMVLIQKHILGTSLLNSPYKIIAADINNSQTVSSIDLVELRKLILGVYNELPNNKSWRFINADFKFNDKYHPFPFSENIEIENLGESNTPGNFVAVKIGDVNQSAKVNQAISTDVRSATPFKMIGKSDEIVSTGGRFSLPVYAEYETQIDGFQFTLQSDTYHVSELSIESGQIAISDDNTSNAYIHRGLIAVSWNENETKITTDKPLFYITGVVQNVEELKTNLSLNSRLISSEIYMSGMEVIEQIIEFQIDDSTILSNDDSFELFQNRPNPFSKSTNINFNLPKDETAILRIFDINGRLLITRRGNYKKGLNSISLDIELIPNTGILYYQLETPTHIANKKMIVIK